MIQQLNVTDNRFLIEQTRLVLQLMQIRNLYSIEQATKEIEYCLHELEKPLGSEPLTATEVAMVNDYCQRSSKEHLESFLKFCKENNLILNDAQMDIAKKLYEIPTEGGKTTLIAFLFKFDSASLPTSKIWFNNDDAYDSIVQSAINATNSFLNNIKDIKKRI
jgi:hypothetical protein